MTRTPDFYPEGELVLKTTSHYKRLMTKLAQHHHETASWVVNQAIELMAKRDIPAALLPKEYERND